MRQGIEAKIRVAIDALYGSPFGDVFTSHCQEGERFLADSETEQH